VDYFEKRGEKVRGVLVAPDITLSAYKLLKEYGFEYVKLDALR
jgi:RecB family endonuclease NucS